MLPNHRPPEAIPLGRVGRVGTVSSPGGASPLSLCPRLTLTLPSPTRDNGTMPRPERRIVLAGASPVRVRAGAPRHRLQPGGEILPSRAACQRPWKQRGPNRRAATSAERNRLVKLSAETCLGGPGRSWRPNQAKAGRIVRETARTVGKGVIWKRASTEC